MRVPALLALISLVAVTQDAPIRPDPPHQCDACDGWNQPQAPFRVFGNTYFVGTAGLGAVLVTSDAGHILLDAGLPQSAVPIDASIRALGFRTRDVKLIVNSHAHYDHGGGIAALQRASGANVAASPDGAQALKRGEPTAEDPQFAFGRAANAFPAVRDVRVVNDGETLRIGSLEVTAHLTPGHTPGSTTWTWRSCEGARCLDLVYADSLNAVSAPAFRFTGDATHPTRIPQFRSSIAKMAALPCDILLAVHPSFAGLEARHRQLVAAPSGPNPFVDNQACRAYAADAGKRLDARIAQEK